MVASDKLFAGSIPEIYDRFLVPLIFEPYARDLAERLAKTEPQNVLETAAGTGVADAGDAVEAAERHAHRRNRPQPADARSGGRRGSRTSGRSSGGRPTRLPCHLPIKALTR